MKKTRITLAIFSACLTAVCGVFVWIMLGAGNNPMSSVLLSSLILIVGVTIVAQIIYALKGQIFEFDGRVAKLEVLFAIICFQVVMQFSFGFAMYAVNQTELQNAGVDSAYAHFVKLQDIAGSNDISDYRKLELEADMPLHIDSIFTDESDTDYATAHYYRFPIDGGKLLMRKSQPYLSSLLQEFAISLLMSLVVSVLLMAELLLLAIKFIDRGHSDDSSDEKDAHRPVGYLRQIAFLFFFTGFFGASFIPIMARDLAGSHPRADFIAGLPYSVEAFANCIAILLSSRIFRKKGWKPPYLIGAALFVCGLAASALSTNVFMFIASRCVVGVGYGFCWMTLRNISTFTENRAQNFAGLSSGIYAGMMCGVAFGAVLADSVGFNNVLLISAAMALLAALFPLILKNTASEVKEAKESITVKLASRDIMAFCAFLGLIVVPTCISEAFGGYLLPLYISDLELPTAYVGRVSLVYNLCLVYISSTVMLKVAWKYIKNPLFQNTLHMLIISGALFVAAYMGGFIAILLAGALLGAADGFGFSVQNAYILDMRVAERIGTIRMFTWLSLFKKFAAMLAPFAFGLFIMDGFGGLGVMGVVFIVCAVAAVFLISLLQRKRLINSLFL